MASARTINDRITKHNVHFQLTEGFGLEELGGFVSTGADSFSSDIGELLSSFRILVMLPICPAYSHGVGVE